LLAKINFLERKVWSAIGAIAVITFLVNTKIINLKSLSSTQTSGTMEQVSPLVRELS
jgi:hypothetical protein